MIGRGEDLGVKCRKCGGVMLYYSLAVHCGGCDYSHAVSRRGIKIIRGMKNG